MGTKKTFVQFLSAALLLALCGCAAAAPSTESYPEKDIHIIYYTRPGSGGDTFLRNLAVAVKDKLNGHSIVIENIIDPSGATSWRKVQRARKDGYTLACLSSTVVTADLIGGSPVKYQDFDYVCGMGMDPQYVYCRADAPYNTLSELIAYCKANPGKVNWGTAMPTSASTICSVEIIKKTGVDVNRVIFGTGSETFVALLGGFVDVGVGEYIDMRAQVEAKQIKLLSLLAKERNALNVPTAVEEGYYIVFDRPRGLAAPKGTDPALVARMAELFKSAYDSKAFMDYLNQEAIEPKFQTGAEFLESYNTVANIIEKNKASILGSKK